jgi:hypothetical protein
MKEQEIGRNATYLEWQWMGKRERGRGKKERTKKETRKRGKVGDGGERTDCGDGTALTLASLLRTP